MHKYHEYYSYNVTQLQAASLIPVKTMNSSEAVFRCIAQEMADCIAENNASGRRTVFIVPVGPVGQYEYFVELVNTNRISLKNVWFFNMDEYLTDEGDWLDISDRLSFRGFMERNVYSLIDPELVMPEEQRVFPDPHNPAKMSLLLDELGGADICFGGIGINGHLAFNEPCPDMTEEEYASLSVRKLAITPETLTANAIGDLDGAIEDMPHLAVTIGIREVLAAKKVRLGVFRTWHRAVIRRAACGEITPAFPASMLQRHPDVVIYANDIASEAAVK